MFDLLYIPYDHSMLKRLDPRDFNSCLFSGCESEADGVWFVEEFR